MSARCRDMPGVIATDGACWCELRFFGFPAGIASHSTVRAAGKRSAATAEPTGSADAARPIPPKLYWREVQSRNQGSN